MGFNLSHIVNESLNTQNVSEIVYGKNQFNSAVAELGGVSGTTGANTADAGWYRTAYIEIRSELNPTSIVFNSLQSSIFVGTAFYDEDKVFISSVTNAAIIANAYVAAIPENAKYFRSTNYGTIGAELWQIEYGVVSSGYEEYYEQNIPQILAQWLQMGDRSPFVRAYTMSMDRITSDSYYKIAERDKYQIYKTPRGTVTAIYRDVAVRTIVSTVGANIEISTNGINGVYFYKTIFNSDSFPGLISGSTIQRIMILPWTRNLTTMQTGLEWRLIVITRLGQIYHNFPSRLTTSDGTEQSGDIIKFEESVIWDLPERKYPSTNVSATGAERYFPCLPSVCYEYHPMLNTDGGYVDTYGNGGFGTSITKTPSGGSATTYPRFALPSRVYAQNSFTFMGGNEVSDKLTLIGTYNSNNSAGEGCRICLFATDDGGRSWYNKYEFASADTSAWCNDIDTTAIVGDYADSSFALKKRTLVVPTAAAKEPTDLFTLGSDVVISSITKAKPAVVTTASAHGLVSGNAIAIIDNGASENLSADWDWMRNDTISTTSGGNGVLFKIKKLTDTTFELHDYVHSAFNNIPARHIHHINHIKDGFIMGTGEEYPQGWQLYIQVKSADTYSVVRAYYTLPIYRLNSADTAMQRTLGVILFDDADSTIVAALDTASISRSNLSLPTGRTDTISRNSTGIFKGKLSDIDDFTKFTSIYEAREPAYFFKEKEGVWIFCSQRGEVAISFDKGETWCIENVGEPMEHFYGSTNGIISIDNYIIALKI